MRKWCIYAPIKTLPWKKRSICYTNPTLKAANLIVHITHFALTKSHHYMLSCSLGICSDKANTLHLLTYTLSYYRGQQLVPAVAL